MTPRHPSSTKSPDARRFASRLRAFARDRAGATAVEFSLVGVVFITLLMGILQFALVFLSQMNMHDAVSDAATGNNAQTLVGNRVAVVNQICLRLVAADNCAANIQIEMQPLAAYGATAQSITGATFAAGAAGTPMLIRARAPILTFVPGLPTLRVAGTAIYMAK